MPRPAKGQILYVERERKKGPPEPVFALRFRAYGKREYLTLGTTKGEWEGYDGPTGWTRERAADKLRHTLADVERGIWKPPRTERVPEPAPDPTFHEFASDWWVLNKDRFAPKTQDDYLWRLKMHLLPEFADYRLDQIRYDTVERYIAEKLARKELSPRSINMTLTLGAAIFESAMERYPDELQRNSFKGRRRRVRERRPQRSYLDNSQAIQALLDATAAMDSEARDKHVHRRAIVATLVFAGLRIGECCDLRWRQVDIATGWLSVGESKTDAGVRRVKIRGALRDVLVQIKPTDANPDAYVFATKTGKRTNPSNIRNRILGPAEERASAKLLERRLAPLPHLTPHSCRRTFASVLYALGENPPIVMHEMGHASPALALKVYAQAMRRDAEENDRLRGLIEGSDWAAMGSSGDLETAEASSDPSSQS